MQGSGGALLAADLDGGNSIRGEAEAVESCLRNYKTPIPSKQLLF